MRLGTSMMSTTIYNEGIERLVAREQNMPQRRWGKWFLQIWNQFRWEFDIKWKMRLIKRDSLWRSMELHTHKHTNLNKTLARQIDDWNEFSGLLYDHGPENAFPCWMELEANGKSFSIIQFNWKCCRFCYDISKLQWMWKKNTRWNLVKLQIWIHSIEKTDNPWCINKFEVII